MGLGRRALTTAGLGLVAAFVVGCGSSQGLLSAHDHDHLTAGLLAVTQAVDRGSCPGTSDALAELDSTIDGLPDSTNATLHKNLVQGAKVLSDNASRQCHHKSPKPPVTSATSTSTSTSTTVTTTSRTTTKAATSSTPAPTTPPQTTETTPPTTQTGSATATSPGPPTTSTNGGAGLAPNGSGGNG